MKTTAPSGHKESNEAFANDASFDSVKLLLRGVAAKCFRRAQAMGLGMEFDDVLQEMHISYLKAKERWNPDIEGAALFSTYCMAACYFNFNTAIKSVERQRTIGKIRAKSAGAILFTENDVIKAKEEGRFPPKVGEVKFQRPFGMVSECEYINLYESDLSAFMEAQSAPVECQPEQFLEQKQEAKRKLATLSLEAKRLVAVLLSYEQPTDNERPSLSAIAKNLNLNPRNLRRVKIEILNTYGVTWI